MTAERVLALVARIADARNLLDAIPEDGIWSLKRELAADLKLIEAEAAALGEPEPTMAGAE